MQPALRRRIYRGISLLALLGALVATPSRQPLAHAASSLRRLPTPGQVVAGSPPIAAALHGDIYTLRADGTGNHRLTTSGRASTPRLSPDGHLVAYLMAETNHSAGGSPAGALYVQPVNVPTGTAGQRIESSTLAGDAVRMSWSPDSSRLAYFRGPTLGIRAVRGEGPDTILQAPHGAGYAGAVAWSPDSRHIAVPLVVRPAPTALEVVVGTPRSARWQRISITFPSGALGVPGSNSPISTPNDDLVWTPDGSGFLFSTVLVGEGFFNITGIWRVGAGGGIAHLVIGRRLGLPHAPLPANSPLSQATHFLLSPNGMLLATDPQRGLWVAKPDGHAGRFLPVRASHPCVLAQYAWLPDSSGLAYVRDCQAHSGSVMQAMTLFSMGLDGSPPRQLYSATSTDPQVIDLGPAYRCLYCGG